MASNGKPQFLRQVFSLQSNGAAAKAVNASVRQDKVRTSSVHRGTRQPVTVTKRTRTDGSGTKTPRSKNSPIRKKQRVLVGLWVKPRVKEELQRIAQTEGISLSSVGSALLEEALQHSLSARYAPLLEPIIRNEIRQQMRGISSRLAWLLVRVAFDTGQTRAIVANILGRQQGITEDVLKNILAMSQRTAKGNITRRTPQIAELMEAVEKWLNAEDEKKEPSN
jgi:hypothetical protein